MSAPAFKLYEVTAAGTFGTVCIALDLHTGRLVALKVLKQAHLHRPRVIARTADEAAMLSRLDHPGIVDVAGLIYVGERPIVVMEWVRGASLEELLEMLPDGLPVGVAVELILQAIKALHAAYETTPAGASSPMHIIHRDVKPSNMLLSLDGVLKMVDFGIARGDFEGKQAKTMSMVLGARGYLAPERLDGHDDKPSVDIYGLGICLYEFLTGKHVVLSVHEAFHVEALESNIEKLRPPGLADAPRDELVSILESMCCYHESERPDHPTLAARLTAFIQKWDLQTDLRDFAMEHVLPHFRDRKRTRPIDHPGYPDLAFLDRTASNCPNPAAADVDAALYDFLRQPNWHQRLDEMDLLLIQNPHWTTQPFLDALPDGSRPWWRFWDRDQQPESAEIAALLDLVGRRRVTSEIRRRLLPMREHPDPEVQNALGRLLSLE